MSAPPDRKPPLRLLRIYSALSLILSLGTLFLFTRSTGQIKGAYWLIPGIVLLVGLGFGFATLLLFIPARRDRLASAIVAGFGRNTNLGVAFFAALVLFLVGLMYYGSASPYLYGPVYPVWMVRFFAWLTLESLLTLFFIVLLGRDSYLPGIPVLILLLGILVSGMLVNLYLWEFPTPHKEDIYFIFQDGRRLVEGENPYARVLSGDMVTNEKYSTYFPIFYGLAWLTQKLGLEKFPDWLSFWREIFVLVNLLIGVVLFWIAGRGADNKNPTGISWNRVALATFVILFWLFNRWTLHVAQTADIDFLPLFLLILSLVALPRHKVLAYLLFGLSLGIKQMGIFLVPLYLIWAWQSVQEHRIREVVLAAAWIALVPLLASLPFLFWNAKGFLLSILFSATREPSVAFEVYSLDTLLGFPGLKGKALMVFLMVLIYWVAYRDRMEKYTGVLLILAVFVFFNTVMFVSYPMWLVPFIALAAVELLDMRYMLRESTNSR